MRHTRLSVFAAHRVSAFAELPGPRPGRRLARLHAERGLRSLKRRLADPGSVGAPLDVLRGQRAVAKGLDQERDGELDRAGRHRRGTHDVPAPCRATSSLNTARCSSGVRSARGTNRAPGHLRAQGERFIVVQPRDADRRAQSTTLGDGETRRPGPLSLTPAREGRRARGGLVASASRSSASGTSSASHSARSSSVGAGSPSEQERCAASKNPAPCTSCTPSVFSREKPPSISLSDQGR